METLLIVYKQALAQAGRRGLDKRKFSGKTLESVSTCPLTTITFFQFLSINQEISQIDKKNNYHSIGNTICERKDLNAALSASREIMHSPERKG